MSRERTILLLEDRPADAELTLRELRGSRLRFVARRVETEEAFAAALRGPALDLILADYALPHYDGLSALTLARRERPGVPFIFVTGTLGEERAVEALHHGATDYVLKHNLARLVPAVRRALREAVSHARRRRAEQALAASERRFRDLFDNISSGVAVYEAVDGGRDFIFKDFNKAGERIDRQKREELIGRSVREMRPGIEVFGLLDVFRRVHRAGVPEQHPISWYKDGVLAGWYENFVYRLPSGEIVAVFDDVTARKRAEEARVRLATAVEQAAETIVITDGQGTILYANPAFERTTGYTRDEAVGQNPRILKSGRQDAAFYEHMWATLVRGEVWSGHFSNKRKDGTLYEEEATISPVRDAAGAIVNYVAVKRDVTAEIRLEEQLRQAQKMEAVGQLAGGVAHDFNNKLQVILGYAEQLLGAMSPGDPNRDAVHELRTAARHSADLTRQLLAFSRKQAIEPVVLDLSATVAGSLRMLGRLLGEDMRLHLAAPPDAGCVFMDPGQLDQVLANLVVNARDAIEASGRVDGVIALETEGVVLGPADRTGPVGPPDALPPGEYVALSVADNGCGMSPEVQAQVFEPFFTTKDVGKGTGLGLATVYGIVRQNRGTVTVASEPGCGATFRILLPRVPAVAGGERARPDPMPCGTETVLLVEDEESVLTLVRKTLEQQGYTVLAASSSSIALKVCRQTAGPIHLLMTDVVMPEMGGCELAERIRAARPGIRVLYMSGYAVDAQTRRAPIPAGLPLVQKPFSRSTIARRVRAALDGPPAG